MLDVLDEARAGRRRRGRRRRLVRLPGLRARGGDRAASPAAAAAGPAAGREPRLLRPRAAPGRGRARGGSRRSTSARCRGWTSCGRGSRRRAPRAFELTGLEPAPGALARHTAAVAACVERIAAGELFQANLTLRLEGRFRGSAADAFLAAAGGARAAPRRVPRPRRRAAPCCRSRPSCSCAARGDDVTTSPIKGTAPREAGAEALLGSAKDAAEHVMIVDLSRNDLGRVADYGSVAPGRGPRRAAPRPVAPRDRRLRARARGHDAAPTSSARRSRPAR